MGQYMQERYDINIEKSKSAALEQLLEVYENTAMEQAEALYGEIARQKRAEAEELARHARELERTNSAKRW